MTIRVRRVHDEPSDDDGFRVLVDRLWPRGVSKENARADLWLKDVAPSDALRRWFHHEEPRFEEFARRYRSELDANAAVADLRDVIASRPVVTLLYGAKDREHNQAVVLRDYLEAGTPAAST
jgi:uncharacterized protein YeaO (DUF488 family)